MTWPYAAVLIAIVLAIVALVGMALAFAVRVERVRRGQ
jgi:hypothetical protein